MKIKSFPFVGTAYNEAGFLPVTAEDHTGSTSQLELSAQAVEDLLPTFDIDVPVADETDTKQSPPSNEGDQD